MQALENLAGTGQLTPEPTSVEEISGFLMRAEQQLDDARTTSLSAPSRFSLAYDAAHAFALVALRAHGYRPGRGLGHRMVVFSTLAHTIASPATEWSALLRYHTKRNSSEYAGLVNASESEARDLIAVTSFLRDRVRAWLGTHRPDLLPGKDPPPVGASLLANKHRPFASKLAPTKTTPPTHPDAP